MKEELLLQRLKRAPFDVQLRMVAAALARAGFGEVTAMDRWTPSQKSRHGGFELLCDLRTVAGRRRTVVKLISRDGGVRIRNVDEMAGTILRTSVSAGVVVSCHGMVDSVAVLAGAARYKPVSLKVIAGHQLARLLISMRVGVDEEGNVDEGEFMKVASLSTRSNGKKGVI